MGVRIIGGDDYAALYCSTTMWAFGPIFKDEEEAEAFCKWINTDPRRLTDKELADKYSEFLSFMEK